MSKIVTFRTAAVGTALLCLSACDDSGSSSLPVSVGLSGAPPTTVSAGTSVSLSAVVFNDNTLGGVSWSSACSGTDCGTFTPASTDSGVPTSYSPPGSVSAAEIVTLTATSTTDPTKKVSTTITITPPPAVLADGSYVYHFSGQHDSGPFFVTGAFTVANGLIAAGEQDFSDGDGVATDTLVPATSKLSMEGDSIQIVLDTGNDDIGDDGVETLRGAIVSPTRVLISQFDDEGAGTGSLDAQDSKDITEQPDGGYAFVISGRSAAPNPLTIGGVLSFDDGDLSVADSVFDINELGVGTAQAQTFDSGSVSEPDNFGRITIILQPSVASNVPALILTGYIIDDGRIQLVESQSDDLGADLGGTALGQGDNAGGFDTNAVAETSYVHGSLGADSNGPLTIAGVFTFNTDGTLAGTLAANDITTHVSNAITAGTYTVDPTGRVTLAGVNTALNFQLYLDGNGNALIMGLDSQDSSAGLAFQQNASSADLDGTYAISAQGVVHANDSPVWGAVGQAIFSSGDVDGSTDYTVQGADPTPAVPLSGSGDSQSGILSLAGLNSQSPDAPEDFQYFPIDDNRTLAVEVAGQQLGLVWLEATNSGDDDDDDD